MATKIQLRKGSAAAWTTANPVLAEGEMGIELVTRKFKFGDGVTAWNSLPYVNADGSGGSGFAIADTYSNIAGLLSNQGDQEANAWYMVQVATTDPTVSSGWAVYQYLGTTAGTLADYMKVIEQESLDLVVNDATNVLKGVMKLYTNLSASNTDGSVAQAAIKAAIDLKQDKALVRERVTDNYTLALADNHKLKEMNNASAKAFTVPPNSAVAFPADETEILLSGYGVGEVSVVAGLGVTINSADGNLKLRARYSFATLIKIGTNEWYLTGDLKA